MNVLKAAREILSSLSLTDDDVKRFSPRGSLASQLATSIGKIMCIIGITTKSFGDTELTVLQLAQEQDASVRADLTIAYDLQNMYLSSDKETSLHELGIGNEGSQALDLVAAFQVDDITETGTFPFKFSRAAQDLDISIGADSSDIDWKKLRTKYNESADMKAMRTDAERDISWLEIKHIYITPISDS